MPVCTTTVQSGPTCAPRRVSQVVLAHRAAPWIQATKTDSISDRPSPGLLMKPGRARPVAVDVDKHIRDSAVKTLRSLTAGHFASP